MDVREMIQECDEGTFETRLSMNQDLTFEYAREEFAKRGLSLGSGEMRTLGMADSAGRFTNLALLLSDQCPQTIKAAAFSDDERSVFTERYEFDGSILKQLNDSYSFLESHNHYRTEFSGLERVDHYDHPAVALREALVNSVAHREYALYGPTLVSAMPSSVEIVSLGGLPTGIEYENLAARISMPRNRALANVLFRLELIEAYGAGIGRMRTSYGNGGSLPEISVTANTFSATLPNRNVVEGRASSAAARLLEEAADALSSGARARAEVQVALGVSQPTASRVLSELVHEGRVLKVGSSRGTRYRLA